MRATLLAVTAITLLAGCATTQPTLAPPPMSTQSTDATAAQGSPITVAPVTITPQVIACPTSFIMMGPAANIPVQCVFSTNFLSTDGPPVVAFALASGTP